MSVLCVYCCNVCCIIYILVCVSHAFVVRAATVSTQHYLAEFGMVEVNTLLGIGDINYSTFCIYG